MGRGCVRAGPAGEEAVGWLFGGGGGVVSGGRTGGGDGACRFASGAAGKPPVRERSCLCSASVQGQRATLDIKREASE